MTTSALDFPSWFTSGWYSGLACCMLAITANALFTAWRKRGTTRQLALAIVSCVCSALLLLPALLWYNLRLSQAQGSIGVLEVACALLYVALCGCVAPLGITTAYCLLTQPRDSNTWARIPRHRTKRTTKGNAAVANSVRLPHRQPGVPAPFVYSEDTPWGWLEYRSGRFQGQKLDLKRALISIGREEDNEIWLDDDTSSRYHAELAWQDGQAYITDCDSLNGVLLNGRRIRGTLPIKSDDLLEIGSHRFLFELVQAPLALNERDDPLLRRATSALEPAERDDTYRKSASASAFPTRPLDEKPFSDEDSFKFPSMFPQKPPSTFSEADPRSDGMPVWMQAFKPDPVTPPPLPPLPELPAPAVLSPVSSSLCIIRNGVMAGRNFLLDRAVFTVGRSTDCDMMLDDVSLAIEHAQFSHQADGDYVYGPGILVNNVPLQAPQLLQKGDIIGLGELQLEYTIVQEAHTAPMPQPSMPSLSRPISGPVPLRLPSKPK